MVKRKNTIKKRDAILTFGFLIVLTGLIGFVFWNDFKPKDIKIQKETVCVLKEIKHQSNGTRSKYAYFVEGIEYELSKVHSASDVVGDKYIVQYDSLRPEEAEIIYFRPVFQKDEQVTESIGTISQIIKVNKEFEFEYSVAGKSYRRYQHVKEKEILNMMTKGQDFKITYWTKNPQRAILFHDTGASNKEILTNNQQNDNNTELDTTALIDFIKSLKFRELPFYDSTNFDNSEDYELLKIDWIELLKLEQIYPYELKIIDKIWIREKLDISENFISLVIGFYPGEHELFTTLVNFSNDFYLIDFETIAYDEIAESCMRTESYLDKNKITKFETDYCYEQSTDTIEYKIENTGEIIASR